MFPRNPNNAIANRRRFFDILPFQVACVQMRIFQKLKFTHLCDVLSAGI